MKAHRLLGWRILLPLGLHLFGDLGGLIVFPATLAARYATFGLYLRDFIVVTAAMYMISEGNVAIDRRLADRFPWDRNPGRRFMVQAGLGWLWALIVGGGLLIVFGRPEMGSAGIEAANGVLVLAMMVNVGILGVFVYQKMKASIVATERHRQDSLAAQNLALRQQVDPHFLFNSLNTLASIIPDDPGAAEKLVQALAKVYRHVLLSRDRETITLGEELDVARDYAYAFALRFGDGFRLEIDVPEEYRRAFIPPLTLQLLVENCVKHNVIAPDRPLRVRIAVEEGGWVVVRNPLQRKTTVGATMGLGLQNIRDRYRGLAGKEIRVAEERGEFLVACPLLESVP
jgi:hypothetical protein